MFFFLTVCQPSKMFTNLDHDSPHGLTHDFSSPTSNVWGSQHPYYQRLPGPVPGPGPQLSGASDDGTLREWSFGGELLRSFTGAEGVQCVRVPS